MNASAAAKQLHISKQTLRRWALAGKLNFTHTPGGHRRYILPEIPVAGKKRRIIYARVSSAKQREDLERQATFISQKYPDYEIIKEIGSGINYERPKFKSILEQLFKGNIEECVVSSSDRFARYGRFFRWLFSQFNAKLTILSEEEGADTYDLTTDLMEIITVFVARYHGRRRYRSAGDSEVSDLSDQRAEEVV